MNVAVIGASNKPDRYSFKAIQSLRAKGHTVFPVHPRIPEVEGIGVYKSVNDIADEIDTVTMYVSKDVSDGAADDIIALNPKRIIFNPGAENDELAQSASAKGILTLNACTLVMLTTGQF